MATIKGTWVFNDAVEGIGLPAEQTIYNVNFASNNVTYNQISFMEGNRLRIESLGYDSTSVYNSTDGWSNEIYKTISITSEPTNASFISWLTANATQQKADPTITFDLSTLNLSAGTHSITVKAKADGYADSAESEAVSYTVAPTTVTLEAGTYVANDGFSISGMDGEYDFAFTSNGTDYIGMTIYDWDTLCSYKKSSGSDYAWYDGWQNTNYKTITTTTAQAVSIEFGEWFNANFELQQTESMIGTWVAVDDPYVWDDVDYSVSFTCSGVSYTKMSIHTITDDEGVGMHAGNGVLYGNRVVYYTEVTGGADYTEGWQNDKYKTIVITAEPDAEAAEYIRANFTKQTVSLISFTIDGTSYEAEEGMTWEEWVESDYNTSGYVVSQSYIAETVSHVRVVANGATPVNPTDTINAQSYDMKLLDGGAD